MTTSTSTIVVAGLIAAVGPLPAAFGQPCVPEWRADIGDPGANGEVFALEMFNDGSGNALYMGGIFGSAGNVTLTRSLARWDGTQWSDVGGGGIAGGRRSIDAMAVYDDGTGLALYVAGNFEEIGDVTAHGIAKWDGTEFSALDVGVGGADPTVSALAVFDDGTGAALYATGPFSTAGGLTANGLARWNGASWTGFVDGVAGEAMLAFDDGGGPALYVAGTFFNAGGVAATAGFARFDGTTWSAVGGGLSGDGGHGTPWGLCLAEFDDGGGPGLYVGGSFVNAGGVLVNRIARWDGVQWSALGDGIPGGPTPFRDVRALRGFDDGSGDALYVGGLFSNAGGVSVSRIARWDGSAWSDVAGGGVGGGVFPSVNAIAGGIVAQEPVLYAGGNFSQLTITGQPAANNIASVVACPAACPADLNGDLVVDVLDLLDLLLAWGQSGVPADINGDGIVDVLDLLELLLAWGEC